MLSCLTIALDKDVKFDGSQHDDLVIIEEVRDNILKFTNGESEQIRSAINNKEHELPSILYSRPYQNKIRIFGIGANGSNGLNAIFKNVIINKTFKIKNEIYSVKGIPNYDGNLDFLPYNNGCVNIYTTLTPINIFNKFNHKIFKAILYKYFIDGNYDASNAVAVEGFTKAITEYANQQIKDSIAYLLHKVLGKSKESYEFINTIQIEWDEIKVVHALFHTEEKKMPMIRGKFRSNFVLPKFVGYKIGKGFGELSLKQLKTDKGGTK